MYNHASGDRDKILASAHAHLVFWGSSWASPPQAGTITRKEVTNALTSIVNSNYLDGVMEYSKDIAKVSAPDSTVITDSFPSSEPPDTTAAFTSRWVVDGKVPFSTTIDDLYFVILPQGADAGAGYGAGYHYSANALLGGRSFSVPFVIIRTDGFDISEISDTLSHELVEAVANPFGSAVYGRGAHTARTPDCNVNVDDTACELADVCDPSGPYNVNDAKTADGYALAAYWLQSKTTCSLTCSLKKAPTIGGEF